MKKAINSLMLAVVLVAGSQLQAQVVWDGDDNGNWDTGGNWVGGTAPVAGDALEFAGTNTANNNDITAGTSFAGIDFAVGASSFTLTGNSITLAGNIGNSSGTLQTIDLDMALAAGQRQVNAPLNSNISLTGNLSGSGSLFKGLVGTLTITGDNAHSGGTNLFAGTLIVGSDTALGTGTIEFTGGGTLRDDGTRRTLANDIVFSTTDSVTLGFSGSRLTLNGSVDLGSDNRSIQVINNPTNGNLATILGGVVSGTAGLTKTGSGMLQLSGTNTFSGGFTLSEGSVIIGNNAAFGSGELTVGDGTTMLPFGNSSQSVSNAVSVEGDFTMQTGSGTLALTGDVDLNGATRTVSLAGNDAGTKALDGEISNGGLTFALASGATAGQQVRLSGVNTYTGDTTVGADVVLTLEDDAAFTFAIGANGVNTALLGTGTVNLDGDFIFDLTGAGIGDGNSWNIVNVAGLTETYGSTFSVTGFSEAADVWTLVDGDNTWTFTESTGVLNLGVIPEPSSTILLLLGMLGLLATRRRR